MSGYFSDADIKSISTAYPSGRLFLDGPARLSEDALRALQEQRFLTLMARGWQVEFYRRRWQEAGLEPGDITNLSDLSKVPTYSKTDIMDSIEANPPFGDFHGVDFSDHDRPNVVLHTTSGTTGEPQPLLFGAADREIQNALLARTYLLQGLRHDDVVQSVYGFGMINGGHYIREAILHFTKALLLPSGTGLETSSKQQIHLMKYFKSTVLVGFVDYLKRLASTCEELGLSPQEDLSIRMISCHLGQEDRGLISGLWGGAEIFDWYGVGDTGVVAAEGPTQNGLHIWEDAHILEILDEKTELPLPNGEEGDVCLTVLFKKSVYPIIRFNTHDVSRILPADFDSGINFRRIPGFLGRSDNMVKLRGINVFPTAIGALLDRIDGLVGEYVCQVVRGDGREELVVKTEVTVPDLVNDDRLREQVSAILRQALNVSVIIELVDPGATAELSEINRRQKPIRLLPTVSK